LGNDGRGVPCDLQIKLTSLLLSFQRLVSKDPLPLAALRWVVLGFYLLLCSMVNVILSYDMAGLIFVTRKRIVVVDVKPLPLLAYVNYDIEG
jgi:hypothetical protein